jgi:hypothetical protein
MSQRHRSPEAGSPPREVVRAKAHAERHRINSALHSVTAQVQSGYQPDEVHEPGRAWVPEHRHDAERAKADATRPRARHWKLKMWKRRSAGRKARAAAFRGIAEHA